MRRLVFALFLLTGSATPSWGAGLTLSIRDGLVSLDAQDVTVRQILAEWERVGKTRIVNAERVAGGPITLKLEGVPEKQALDIILRAIPGYMALPRAAQSADASVYDRILIMATTTAVAPPSRMSQAGFPGAMGGGNVTQLRPMVPLSPGILPDSPNAPDTSEDAAIAAAAAAGLVPMPAFNPGPTPMSPPMMPLMSPGGPNQPQPQPALTPPGTGAPTNPWNAPVGTAQPSLAPPQPQPQPQQGMPTQRMRMPQADQ